MFSSNRNLTIAFFQPDQRDACNALDISSAISLSTATEPLGYTCFNLSDIFSQPNKTGFQNSENSRQTVYDGRDDPIGVAWTLSNLDNYDDQANYSNIWYHQQAITDPEEGEPSRWVLYTYAFEDCVQVVAGVEDSSEYPWFEVSCQTGPDGECHTTPRPIRSFAIFRSWASRHQDDEDENDTCKTWAERGAATSLLGRQRAAAGAMMSVFTVWLMMM